MALHTGTTGPVIRADNMEPEVLRQLVAILSGSRDGILRGADLAVTQNGGGAMSVLVASGFALISGTDSSPVQGQYHVYNDASVTVTVPTANPSNPRIDLICVTLEDAYYAGGSNTAILQDVAGTPGASPAVPATPADSLVLAHIYVGTGAASILTANINGTTGANNPDTIAFTPLRCEGLLAKGSPTGGTNTSAASPGTLIAGTLVTVNVPANRNIKISYSVPFTQTAGGPLNDTCNIYRDGTAGTVIADGQSRYYATSYGMFSGVGIDNPPAGMHTYGLYTYGSAAQTQTFAAGNGRIIVEDDGPV